MIYTSHKQMTYKELQNYFNLFSFTKQARMKLRKKNMTLNY